jgi:hypothetical protein
MKSPLFIYPLRLAFLLIIIIIGSCDNTQTTFKISNESKIVSISDTNNPLHGLIISFPQNEYIPETKVSVDIVSTPPFDELYLNSLSPSFEFRANVQDETNFAYPVQITIPLYNHLANIPIIGFYDKQNQAWKLIKVEQYDSLNNTLSFKTNHFSIYKAFEIDVGGISNIIQKIKSNFELVYPFPIKTNQGLEESTISGLKYIKEAAYMNLIRMSSDYELCKQRTSCKLLYEDLIRFISETIISQSTEKILTGVVLKGTTGASIVSVTFVIGEIISAVIVSDCLFCFLPNSTLSANFWVNFLTYHIAGMLLENSGEPFVSVEEIECPPRVGDVLKDLPVIKSLSKYKASVGDLIEINGCFLSGFEHDKNAIIENSNGTHAVLFGQEGSSDNLIIIRLDYKICQTNTSYSGEECEAWLTLDPGFYSIYVDPWTVSSNKVRLEIKDPHIGENKVADLSIQYISNFLLSSGKIDEGNVIDVVNDFQNIDLNGDHSFEILVFNSSKAGAKLAPTFLINQNPLQIIGEDFGPRVEVLKTRTNGYLDLKDYGPGGSVIKKWNGTKYANGS